MENSNSETKQAVARKAYEYLATKLHKDCILGIGTGSTTNFFIHELINKKPEIKAIVSSSIASTQLLEEAGLEVSELNDVGSPDFYIDGADEVNEHLQLIKGGGGALTREKIVAAASKKFVCMVDESKSVEILGRAFPVPIEVLPQARSYVARQLAKLGGEPVYREDFVTDYGNVILDTYDLDVSNPIALEKELNNIVGVVCNGIFAANQADVLLKASADGVTTLTR